MTRADALRNRARVVEAAGAVFAEHGPEAGVDEVALAAGVGKATIYRSFPSKDHLVSAAIVAQIDAFVARAEAALGSDDAWAAFEDLMVAAAEAKAARVLGGLVAAPVEVPELPEARERMRVALQAVLDRAKAQGSARGDADASEVSTLFAGLCRVLGEREERDPAVWRRHAQLIAAGFRA